MQILHFLRVSPHLIIVFVIIITKEFIFIINMSLISWFNCYKCMSLNCWLVLFFARIKAEPDGRLLYFDKLCRVFVHCFSQSALSKLACKNIVWIFSDHCNTFLFWNIFLKERCNLLRLILIRYVVEMKWISNPYLQMLLVSFQ